MNTFSELITIIVLALSQIFTPVNTSEEVEELATSSAKVLEVIDGDTIVVDIGGKEEFVRYIGIDTPEFGEANHECYAEEATEANSNLVDGRTVTLEADQEDRDKYNRLLRHVYVDDKSVNAELVRQGFAYATYYYPNDSYRAELAELERGAKASQKGLWKECFE